MGKWSRIKTSLSKNEEKASDWYEDNKLKGNYSKYRTMTVQNKREITNPTMSIQGSEIESTEKPKLLGVTVDSKINFNHHTNNVCKKASQMIGALVRLKNLIPTEARLQLYKAAILPYLTYCHLTWHFCKSSDRKKLERIQKRGLRAVLRTNILATRNYWQKQAYHRYATGDYRTLPSSCIRY